MNKCLNCEFWELNNAIKDPNNLGGNVPIGECHANPPTVFLIPVQAIQGHALQPQPVRPMTFGHARACRFYELSAEAIQGYKDA